MNPESGMLRFTREERIEWNQTENSNSALKRTNQHQGSPTLEEKTAKREATLEREICLVEVCQ